MKVSVVIPAHNEEKFIATALESIRAQSVAPDEVIVVDNLSTDKTAQIASSLGARVVSEEKKGIVFARNTGFDAASHEIIVRLDADTRAGRDWIEKIKHHVSEGKHALTGMIYYDLPYMNKHTHVYDTYEEFSRLLFGHYVYTGLNMIITKDLWHKCKPLVCLNEKIAHEDLDLSIVVTEFTKLWYERDVVVYTSGRRIVHNPRSFFVEYQLRGARQLLAQKKRLSERKTKEFTLSLSEGFAQGKGRTDRALQYLEKQLRETSELTNELRTAVVESLISSPKSKLDQTLSRLTDMVTKYNEKQ